MSKKINLKISGIHCKSCKTLIEEEVKDLKGIKKIEVNHQSGVAKLEVTDDYSKKEFGKTIKRLGYEIVEENESEEKKESTVASKGDDKKKFFLYLFLLALFVSGYFLIQLFGGFEILAKLNENNVGFGLVVLIGFLSSFHCIGMCGGLVVTYSASVAESQKKNNYLPHFQYNLGRLISYTIIGGILGGFGSFFGINPSFSGFVILIAGFFMILMGLSILTHFKWLDAVKIKTPDFIAKFLYQNKKSDKPKGPLVIGLLTGFMPCGPLQAMQLFALTTGSVFSGALAMFLYSIGTIPLMFGFGSVISLISHTKVKQILKVSGLVVLILGVFMINRGLVNFGMGFNNWAARGTDTTIEEGEVSKDVQLIEMDVTYSGYKPNVIYIKKDVPVRWVIRDKGITGCTNEIFLYHEDGTIKKKLNKDETIIEFTPTKLGELKFSCWMRMVWGKFIVTDDDSQVKGAFVEEANAAEGATCGGSTCTGAETEASGGGCGGSCGGTCGGGGATGGCGCGG